VTQEMKTGFEKAKRIVGQWPRLPKAVAVPPLSWITQTYNVEQKTGMPKGGHFAALEQPDLLVADIGKVFAKIDQKQAKNAPRYELHARQIAPKSRTSPNVRQKSPNGNSPGFFSASSHLYPTFGIELEMSARGAGR
jgi:hypothetical protein